MSIKIKLFASLAESLKRREVILDYEEGMTVSSVWAEISEGAVLPPDVMMALNMTYCEGDAEIEDGDEVAYFPPVTGG